MNLVGPAAAILVVCVSFPGNAMAAALVLDGILLGGGSGEGLRRLSNFS